MAAHTQVRSVSLLGEFDVERAFSKLSLAAIKSTLGQPVAEVEVSSARLLIDEYTFQKERYARSWSIPEKLVPIQEQTRLEETLAKLPLVGKKRPDLQMIEKIVPLLNTLLEKRGLACDEGEALLVAIHEFEEATRLASITEDMARR